MIEARFDGGCVPNPNGDAACSCLVTKDGEEIHRESKYLGIGSGMTNNVAEFSGLMMILKWILKNEIKEKVHIIGDSQVVIRRMSGKAGGAPVGVCAPLAQDCLLANRMCQVRPSYEWQGRGSNDECDEMCNLEIDEARLERSEA